MKLVLFLFFLAVTGSGIPQINPIEHAEDNWGNPVYLADSIKQKTTLISPFSTSRCGYCLQDGYFIEKNYNEANIANGGASFHMCLFNPQLDIYSFIKHFKYACPVLTYPPALNDIHATGFPAVLAFKKGKQVFGPDNFYRNYFDYPKLRKELWTDAQKMVPVGNLQQAYKSIFENGHFDAIFVFPTGFEISNEDIEDSRRATSYICKNIDSLTFDDLQKNLMFSGDFKANELVSFFKGNAYPFEFSEKTIEIGDYKFPFDSVGLSAWITSPFNPEKYIVFRIWKKQKINMVTNFMDFLIYSGTGPHEYKQLFYGNYDNSEGKNTVLSDMIFSDIVLNDYCKTYCNAPQKSHNTDHADEYNSLPVNKTSTDHGEIWTIGTAKCRFPDITGDKNNTYVSFEENGDIILSRIRKDDTGNFIVESNETDSYNPVVASDGQRIWVFYLNNRDSYYRLYARFLENDKLSDEILISEKGPYDVITINTASTNKEISVIWCEWKANQRFLKIRTIKDGAMGEIMQIKSLQSKEHKGDYSNAWYPSLCYLESGDLWGAWNQHYPSYLGVVGGKIGDELHSVTLSAENINDREVGGYPCIFSNNDKIKYVVYESDFWDTYDNPAQTIRISLYNDEMQKWSVSSIISEQELTCLNQTPVGICDKDGNIVVIWSGRSKNPGSSWGIFYSIRKNGHWSKPELISEPGICSRHPRVYYDKDNNSIWVSWHSGIGDSMITKVLKLSNNK